MIPKVITAEPAPGAPPRCARCGCSGRNPRDFVQVVHRRMPWEIARDPGPRYATHRATVFCVACEKLLEQEEIRGSAPARESTIPLWEPAQDVDGLCQCGKLAWHHKPGLHGFVQDPDKLGDVAPEPRPVPNWRTPIADLVIEDLRAKKAVGVEKYGTPLQAFNGRRALVDAYQETLDLSQYLKQEIEEREEIRAKVIGYVTARAENFRAEEAKARESRAELKADELAHYATALEDLARLIDNGAIDALRGR